MHLDEPRWWYGGADDVRQRALAPLGRLYGWIAERRYRRRHPYRSRLPVICVGNFTAGRHRQDAAVALHRSPAARPAAQRPVFLTRGYGGRTAGPAWVDDAAGRRTRCRRRAAAARRRRPDARRARPHAPASSPSRRSGRDPSVVIMDDGLQNPAVAKDLSIAVVDGKRGIGNGEVIPAGPLRAPLEFQIGLVDAIVVRDPPSIADAGAGVHARAARRISRPGAGRARSQPSAIPPGSPNAAARRLRRHRQSAALLCACSRAWAASCRARVVPRPPRLHARRTPSACRAGARQPAPQLVTTEKDFATHGAAMRRWPALARANARAAHRLDVRRARSGAPRLADRRRRCRTPRGATVRRRSAKTPRDRARACRASAGSAASRPPARRRPPAARRSSSAGRAA